MPGTAYDLVVVGGGINGCGIARDAAGRSLSVLLCEQSDLASATSSASTKLIHGGLRYLEHYEFRLVRESLIERERLWRMAPHVIWPLRFVLPHHPQLRPTWLIRLGLFLYDHLGGRRDLPAARALNLANDAAGLPLKTGFRTAFEYSDCWVDDARLVVLNAIAAAERGADIRVRTRCVAARQEAGLWEVSLRDGETGVVETVTARILVNAAGPWASTFLDEAVHIRTDHRVRCVKGSHIIVRRLYSHDRAYIFQNDDKRIVFAIPYETDFLLIGTTDLDYTGDPAAVAIDGTETAYLCDVVNRYFGTPVRPEDVVHSYAGVRPLYDDGATLAQEATRDYVLKIDGAGEGKAPILNVFGGKLTTFRTLAEHAMRRLRPFLSGMGGDWTEKSSLPGGDFPTDAVADLAGRLRRDHPFLTAAWALRLVRSYGTRAGLVLGAARSEQDLGEHFGDTLFAAEAAYLVDHEWARSADDILWRRSKLGLRLSAEQAARLDQWVTDYRVGPPQKRQVP